MRNDSKLFILGGLVIAVMGFLLLDTYRLPSRPSIVQIVSANTILFGLPYRYVLVFSVLLLAFGIYRQWENKK